MRRKLAAAVALAVALTGAGCGSDGPTPIEVVRASSAKTLAAESSKVSITITTEVDGTPTTMSGEGAFDYTTRRGTLTMDLGSLLAGTTVEVRSIGDVIYTSVPPVAAGLLGGKKFMRIDLKALAAKNETFASLRTGTDPSSGLDALRGAKDVKKVGTEQVRGEATTHYRGTIDLGEAKAELSGDAAAAIEHLRTTLKVEEIPFEAWLDDAGRSRRMKMSIDSPGTAATGNKPQSVDMTIETFDFGTKVDVVEPPAAEVADGTALLEGVAAGAGVGAGASG
ncbi:MAG TPA: LppX_LprAFG lipoprotein [Mycobacteriales bacterium]|nr:LppX_LprAFG lipoprotein [Mycobacteriales bacterium]